MRIEFCHQVVRDLAWAIGSPSLLRSGGGDRVSDDWCRLAFHDRIPWLRELDKKPDELLAWLAQRKSRLLGVYFESLIEYWLTHWRRMRLHAARLPLKEAGRTIGEFDFLFCDRYLGIDYHWETAVKFFLHYRQEGNVDDWLGPNPRDTWLRKSTRVFGHQLKLSARPEALPVLRRLGMEALQPKAFFKGYLFEHIGEAAQPGSLLPELSPNHLTGWWCHLSESGELPQEDDSNRWLSLSRLHWLSAVYSKEATPGMGREACLALLEAHFDGSQKPVLLAELAQGADGIWRECGRGFVVADNWPALASLRGDRIPSHE
jgi:hypothetical protein